MAGRSGNTKAAFNSRQKSEIPLPSSLKKEGYRIIHFLHHRYLMLYRAEGQSVYVDAVYHQLQNYENTFANELNR